VILLTYADYSEVELASDAPRIVHVDASNRVLDEASAALEAGSTEPPASTS
jgi:aspartate 1-decarboxylase